VDVREVFGWLRRLLYLDVTVFDEVRSNPSATIPGVLVAIVASFIAGLGGWGWWLTQDFGGGGDIFIHSAVIGSLIAVVLWGLAWLGIVYLLLTQVFRQRAYVEQLLRVMGLAMAPLAIMGLLFVPGLSLGIGIASLGLTFGLMNIAIKSVTTADNSQVLASNFLGFCVWAAVLSLLATSSLSSARPHAPGIFLYHAVSTIADDIFELSP
jgi:hypothetical protein